MDYGRLIGEAWAMTWRYRFLWLLGLFAGSTANCSIGGQWPGGGPDRVERQDMDQMMPGFGDMPQAMAQWVMGNLGLIVAVAVVAALVGLAFFVLWRSRRAAWLTRGWS